MSFTRTGWRVLVVSLLAGLAVLWPVGQASAHDSLLATSPKKGSVVTTAPTAITLTFSDDVAKIAPTVVLRGPEGKVSTDPPSVRANTVRTGVSDELADGRYTVAWRVVSSDGHPIEGTFRFTVEAGESSSASTSPTPTTSAPKATKDKPSTTPVPGAGGDSTSSAVPIAVGLALLVVIAVVAVVAWRRRRS